MAYFLDNLQKDALERLNGLVEIIGEFEPEVQMLVCDSCAAEDGNFGLTRLKGKICSCVRFLFTWPPVLTFLGHWVRLNRKKSQIM